MSECQKRDCRALIVAHMNYANNTTIAKAFVEITRED
jgi:hypothetical protein